MGGAILDPAVADYVVRRFREDDFGDLLARAGFAAISAARAAGEPLEVANLEPRLDPLLPGFDVLATIAVLTDAACPAAAVDLHAAVVRAASRRRRATLDLARAEQSLSTWSSAHD